MADTVTIPLTKPITAHNETLSELTLRMPTVKELRVAGAPYRNADGGVTPDFAACAKLIAMICVIPPSSVDQMNAPDFNVASLELVGFTWGLSAQETAPAATATSTGS